VGGKGGLLIWISFGFPFLGCLADFDCIPRSHRKHPERKEGIKKADEK